MVTGAGDTDVEDKSRRFDVELFVIHPTIDPSAVSSALALEPSQAHRVGDPRVTPKGTALPGSYRDTRWRFSARYEVKSQYFAAEVQKFVDRLANSREFLHHLRATGGRTCLVLQFLGDGYFGDVIQRNTLAQLVDLHLDLGIECYADSQR